MSLGSHVSSDLSTEDRDATAQPHSAESPFEPETASQPPVTTPADAGTQPEVVEAAAPVWLQRLSLVMLVLFCVYLGVLVAIMPWWTRVWDENIFINSHPALAAFLHLGAVRGIISGLGLIDIWIGISEAIHYRDHRP